MPIYEYRCEKCGKRSEFLVLKIRETFRPECPRCKSRKMSRLVSRVRIVRSEERRLESLDPTRFGGIDENDPRSVARWMKRMGKEMGEDMGDEIDEVIEEAMEEEARGESQGNGDEDTE